MDANQAKFEGWAQYERLAYIAGLFDGEGCVYISRKKSTGINPSFGLHVSVSNCHCRILELLKGKFGGYIKHHTETRPNQRDWFTWQLAGGKMAVRFLEAIKPYSIIKSEQIALGLEFAKRICLGAKVLTAEEVTVRQDYKDRIAALKRSA